MKTIACGLLLCFLAGCTAYQSEPLIPGFLELDFYSSTGAHRGMYDPRTYMSTYSPNIKISVDPAFRYMPSRRYGKLRHQFLGPDADVYIHYYPNGRVNSHQGEFPESIDSLFWGGIAEKDVVDKGQETLAGYGWETCVWISQGESGCLMTKDAVLSTVDRDILFLRYVEQRRDVVCEQVTNRNIAVVISDWAEALKANFHQRLNFERVDLTTLGLGRHPSGLERIERLNDDALVQEIEYTSGR